MQINGRRSRQASIQRVQNVPALGSVRHRPTVRYRLAILSLLLISVCFVALSLGLAAHYGSRLILSSRSLAVEADPAGTEPYQAAERSAVGTTEGGFRVEESSALQVARPVEVTVVPASTQQEDEVVPGDADTATETVDEEHHLELPQEVLLRKVPLGKQTRNLSCELQSASDLAWYYGKPYTWEEVFLRVGHDPGGNPHKGFVGDSLDDPPGQLYPEGYGVYAEPVAEALRELGLSAEVHYGEPAIWLQEQLAQGRPVMVWATANMVETPVTEWLAEDGTMVRGARGEHTYLVVGYTGDGVWVSDPWDGDQHFYAWELFLNSWDIFDRMSIVIPENQNPRALTATK